MRYLGNSSLKINRVGFGGIPIQRITQEDTTNIIKELEIQGINFIDTARGYTISEEYIGNALINKRDKFILATKSMSRDYNGMKKDIEISLNNLKTDYIDLYQFHNVKPNEYENLFSNNGAYKALLEAKKDKKIKYIGITAHSLETLEMAIQNDYFSTVQFPYNIVENQGDEILKKAHSKGIGTIIMKPLAGGAIDDGSLAIKYILSKPYLDVVIPGMDSVNQVKENIKAKNNLILTEEDDKKIDDIRNSLGKNFCRRCEYCLPCPQNINIPTNFLLEGYFTRYNLKDWAKERYAMLESKVDKCIDCGLCEKKCPYDLPIRDMLSIVANNLG